MKLFTTTSLSSLFSVRSSKQKAWKSHLYVEWFTVLFVSALFLIGIAAWSTYMYGDVLNRLSAEGGVAEQNSTLSVDRNSLTQTLTHFEKKKERYESLGTSRPTYADPSR